MGSITLTEGYSGADQVLTLSSFVSNSIPSYCLITSTVVNNNDGTTYSGPSLVDGDSFTISTNSIYSENIKIVFSSDDQSFERTISINVEADCSSAIAIVSQDLVDRTFTHIVTEES